MSIKEAPGSFTPKNKLESLLQKAALDPDERSELFRAIPSETLLVLGKASADTSLDPRNNSDTQVELYGINIDTRRVIPAFTSEYRIQEFIATPQPYISLSGKDLIELLEPDVGLVLNPASACGKEFLPTEIKRLRSAHID